jgi:general L-amino acid transport system substrate-binding protein
MRQCSTAPFHRCGVLAASACVVALLGFTSQVGAQQTAGAIKQRGILICGVDPGIPGFAFQDTSGKYQGLDVDLCRATAAAIFGDAEKVKYAPLTATARFPALQSGEIDLLVRDSGFNFTRNTQMGLQGAAINFYAGLVFMVKKSLGVKSAKELNGATLCAIQGSTIETNSTDFARANNITINVLSYATSDESIKAYLAGRCDVLCDDNGSIAAIRSTFKNPEDHVILPEMISNEPNAAFTRQGDEQFTNIVKWSHNAMVLAEVLGVTSKNVDEMREKGTNPEMKRLLGVEGDLGPMLGLDRYWAYNIIKQVGNYGESYEKYFGMSSPLKLPRGMNSLPRDGGLMFSPPFR